MNSFTEKLLRLKNELKIQDDKDIAEILGLGVKAFSARKSRGSFPEKELFALKAKRPELNLDMDYILLGTRRKVFEAMEAETLKGMPAADEPMFNIHRDLGNITQEESLLLQHFRLLNSTQRVKAFDALKGLVLSQFLDEGRFPELSAELKRSIVE
ncbi:helix-turn-helix domain-containing protein [Glaesserella parasuis]|uniref:helix-turn-helix domain-containing protein n=1 Tax=Glaesserella parasuis TaxID=738 RepID=UPI0019248FB0|nr:helix-turn-helix domain-containing protein [Glaesserella parasuis]MDE3995312.1 helix-turn-helix domain containing protein [Glaesserella parasuis]MDE4013061.1 helix-turn-helix domain containing protein [Glaesserella parasuis]MDG6300508.1 hypothetical protein [Glaesserella parasuis]